VKKFLNENREVPKGGKKQMENGEDVIDAKTARATFKVLQVKNLNQKPKLSSSLAANTDCLL
jgi:hypothetical protein